MKFSIITPSFSQLDYLKRCVASVADQNGLEVEHIVVDGGSTDGTVEWLKQSVEQLSTDTYRLTFISEADSGMYDALNKGFGRATGEIFAWLNCDEQYLPDTLAFVHDWFATHPEKDLLFGSTLLIRPDGSLIAYRKTIPARWACMAASHLYNLSCGMFFRRGAWARSGPFDSSYRNLGDQKWVMQLLRAGVQTDHTSRFLSAFCFTGQNLSRSEEARREEQCLYNQHPAWIRRFRCPLNLLRWFAKALCGTYYQRPFDYSVYPDKNADCRKIFHIKKAPFQWPKK